MFVRILEHQLSVLGSAPQPAKLFIKDGKIVFGGPQVFITDCKVRISQLQEFTTHLEGSGSGNSEVEGSWNWEGEFTSTTSGIADINGDYEIILSGVFAGSPYAHADQEMFTGMTDYKQLFYETWPYGRAFELSGHHWNSILTQIPTAYSSTQTYDVETFRGGFSPCGGNYSGTNVVNYNTSQPVTKSGTTSATRHSLYFVDYWQFPDGVCGASDTLDYRTSSGFVPGETPSVTGTWGNPSVRMCDVPTYQIETVYPAIENQEMHVSWSLDGRYRNTTMYLSISERRCKYELIPTVVELD